MGLAANLDIAIAITALLTDLRQYMIATSGIATSNFDPYVVSEIATVNTLRGLPMPPHRRYLHLADQVENFLQDLKPTFLGSIGYSYRIQLANLYL